MITMSSQQSNNATLPNKNEENEFTEQPQCIEEVCVVQKVGKQESVSDVANNFDDCVDASGNFQMEF